MDAAVSLRDDWPNATADSGEGRLRPVGHRSNRAGRQCHCRPCDELGLTGGDYFWGLDAGALAPFRVAPVEEAGRFSFQTGLEIIGDKWYLDDVPFGCHGAWNLQTILDLRAGGTATSENDITIRRILDRSGNI